jgi:hypothetical protein
LTSWATVRVSGMTLLHEISWALNFTLMETFGRIIITNILAPWSRVLFEKLTVTQLVEKEFPVSYGTRRFITVFARIRHCFLSWARWIQSTLSIPIFLIYVLVSSFHVHLCLQSGLFLSGFPTIFCFLSSLAPVRAAWLYCFFGAVCVELGWVQFGRSRRNVNLLQPAGLWNNFLSPAHSACKFI